MIMSVMPVQGAAEGSRTTIPMLPRPWDLCIDPANARREHLAITLNDGRAASSSCLDPPRAHRPFISGGRA
ncbi:MAG: hypothetical protein GXX95_01085 [Methanomassiliicoccus sp.]|nr:hypothetical protein [Methanomassiliicoccus sp.]